MNALCAAQRLALRASRQGSLLWGSPHSSFRSHVGKVQLPKHGLHSHCIPTLRQSLPLNSLPTRYGASLIHECIDLTVYLRELRLGSLLSAPRISFRPQHQRWSASKTPEDQKSSPSEKPNTPQKPGVLSRIPNGTHENIYTIPNLLTFSRLVAAPLVGYLLVHDYHGAALSLFAYAGITDLIDGYIARRYQLQTVVGTIIDPMADKLLMTIGVACLAVNGSLPVWLAVIILGRDVGLAISAIYYRWITLPPPKTMARYWDFSLPSAEVKPTEISKINTALQLVLVGSAIALPVVPEAIVSAWHLNEAMGIRGGCYHCLVWSWVSLFQGCSEETVSRRVPE
ncbi:hypothetical protein NUU61_007226 [Penicillium alfredii]|uniref:Phosphatidyl synthase n=1 Tax=Penicillium alfredii TaxID=1506179 RepID=A0A9W9K4J0_9EURO|nr:uncharacterized protein NUU61_007226 [Penicillium alfredii]KAJ5092356.1 hypothetical protein NUU61_007226 [Penicillium alfredii]